MLESRAERSPLESRAERSPLGAALDVVLVDVGLNFLSPKTQLLNHTSEKTNDPSTISAQEICSDFARMTFVFATRPKSEGRNRIRILISPTTDKTLSYSVSVDWDLNPGLLLRYGTALEGR